MRPNTGQIRPEGSTAPRRSSAPRRAGAWRLAGRSAPGLAELLERMKLRSWSTTATQACAPSGVTDSGSRSGTCVSTSALPNSDSLTWFTSLPSMRSRIGFNNASVAAYDERSACGPATPKTVNRNVVQDELPFSCQVAEGEADRHLEPHPE